MSEREFWEKRRRERRERKREMLGNAEDRLRDLREEMAEISLRIERLERAMLLEGSGSSNSSGMVLGGSGRDQG